MLEHHNIKRGENMQQIIGCTIEGDYKPRLGCPFEDSPHD